MVDTGDASLIRQFLLTPEQKVGVAIPYQVYPLILVVTDRRHSQTGNLDFVRNNGNILLLS